MQIDHARFLRDARRWQTYDQRTQAKRVAQANVAAQEAAVRQAELDLEFTELRAPVSGRGTLGQIARRLLAVRPAKGDLGAHSWSSLS